MLRSNVKLMRQMPPTLVPATWPLRSSCRSQRRRRHLRQSSLAQGLDLRNQSCIHSLQVPDALGQLDTMLAGAGACWFAGGFQLLWHQEVEALPAIQRHSGVKLEDVRELSCQTLCGGTPCCMQQSGRLVLTCDACVALPSVFSVFAYELNHILTQYKSSLTNFRSERTDRTILNEPGV